MKPLNNRVLFNGDCNYLFASDYRHPDRRDLPYDTTVLDAQVDRLAASGVDTHVINPTGQVPWYPSKKIDHVLTGYTRGDGDYVSPHYPPADENFTKEKRDNAIATSVAMLDRLFDLQEAGIDWAAHMAARSRQQGMSPWVSVRMNDAHGANNWEGSYFNCPPQRNPKFRLRGKPLNPKDADEKFLQVCNFEYTEVRDYYLDLIRELIEDYDFDGMELDWLRYPACCEPPASKQAIDTLIQWQSDIRAVADARAKVTGKPYYVGMRIPPRIGAMRTIGLDVVVMAREGLIDFVTLSNFWQTSWDIDFHAWRRLLGDNVAIYGGVEGAPNWMFAHNTEKNNDYYRLLPTSDALILGNAAGKLAAGADGIETFNWFCADVGAHVPKPTSQQHPARYETLAHAKSLESMRGKPKHYALSTTVNFWTPRYFEAAGQIPALIETGGWKTFHLHMAAEPNDTDLTLRVQVIVDKTDQLPSLGVSLNGCWPSFEATASDELLLPAGPYTQHVKQYVGLNYELPISAICDGMNELVVYDEGNVCSPDPAREVDATRIIAVELAVV